MEVSGGGAAPPVSSWASSAAAGAFWDPAPPVLPFPPAGGPQPPPPQRQRQVACGGGAGRKRERERCQVEGCEAGLEGAKEYHRRHRVCERHSKAPAAVVLGVDQRFCQQCSRFHAIAEFDDAKRSCRRRLAGHNERRRKSNAIEAMARASSLPYGDTALGHGFPYFPTSPARALSLLSSRASPWLPIPVASAIDLPSRPGTALDELIAENRAALLAWQLFSERSGWNAAAGSRQPEMPGSWSLHQNQLLAMPGTTHLPSGTGHYHGAGAGAGHVTLNLMQAGADASFRPIPGRSKANDGGEDCSDIWKSWEGAGHVV